MTCHHFTSSAAGRGAEAAAPTLPDYIVVVTQVEFLLVFPGVVHNSDTGHEIHDLLGGGVVQVVAALVPPVPVHPLQSQVAVRSSSVGHVQHFRGVCVSSGSLVGCH